MFWYFFAFGLGVVAGFGAAIFLTIVGTAYAVGSKLW